MQAVRRGATESREHRRAVRILHVIAEHEKVHRGEAMAVDELLERCSGDEAALLKVVQYACDAGLLSWENQNQKDRGSLSLLPNGTCALFGKPAESKPKERKTEKKKQDGAQTKKKTAKDKGKPKKRQPGCYYLSDTPALKALLESNAPPPSFLLLGTPDLRLIREAQEYQKELERQSREREAKLLNTTVEQLARERAEMHQILHDTLARNRRPAKVDEQSESKGEKAQAEENPEDGRTRRVGESLGDFMNRLRNSQNEVRGTEKWKEMIQSQSESVTHCCSKSQAEKKAGGNSAKSKSKLSQSKKKASPKAKNVVSERAPSSEQGAAEKSQARKATSKSAKRVTKAGPCSPKSEGRNSEKAEPKKVPSKKKPDQPSKSKQNAIPEYPAERDCDVKTNKKPKSASKPLSSGKRSTPSKEKKGHRSRKARESIDTAYFSVASSIGDDGSRAPSSQGGSKKKHSRHPTQNSIMSEYFSAASTLAWSEDDE